MTLTPTADAADGDTGSENVTARLGYFLISAAVLCADQATKILAHHYLSGRGPVEVIPDLFNLSYSRNPGGLFGYFGDLPDFWRVLLLTGLPVAAVGLIGWFVARGDDSDLRTLWGLALILGGAAGNLIDRIVRGEVVDFLDVYAASPRLSRWLVETVGTAHWPTFNIADSAIVVGACLLLWTVLLPPATGASGSSMPDPGA